MTTTGSILIAVTLAAGLIIWSAKEAMPWPWEKDKRPPRSRIVRALASVSLVTLINILCFGLAIGVILVLVPTWF